MMPIDFQEANITYGKPASMTDEQCPSIRARKTETEYGTEIITVWQPSKEDIEAINAGRPIILAFYCPFMIAVSMWTNDENLKPNV